MTISLLVTAAVLSVMIGLVLGMLGGGGAILMVPMLVYVLGVEPKAAIATSLVVVGSTSLVAALTHARSRPPTIRWKVGLLFASSAMIFAFGGGWLAHWVSATALLVVFAAAMLATAIAMLRPQRGDNHDAGKGSESNERSAKRPSVAVAAILGIGSAVGLLSGLVGAGGGFLIVPALTLFGGLAIREAIGTSLFIIGLQSIAGFASHARYVELDWQLIAVAVAAALAGSVVGSQLGRIASPATLRRAFGVLVLAMGLFVIGKELHQ